MDYKISFDAPAEKVYQDFTETPFLALDDMWERELGDIFGEAN